MPHIWSREDNLLAIEAYYSNASNSELEDLAIRIGVSKGSMNYKIKNILYLDTSGQRGYSHTSQKLIHVWEEYLQLHNIR
jgi:hypothetical protein